MSLASFCRWRRGDLLAWRGSRGSRLDGEGLMASAWSSRTSPVSYSPSAKLMHWFVAAAVIVLLAVGPVMKRLVPEGSLRDNLYTFHEALGALVLIVMVVRLARRVAFGVPAPDASMPAIEQRASLWAQYALYALIIRHDRARLGGDQRLRRSGQRLWSLRLSNHSRQGSAAVRPHYTSGISSVEF